MGEVTSEKAPLGYGRWIASWDDLNDEELLRRTADDLRRCWRPEQAARLDAIADNLVTLARMVSTSGRNAPLDG